LLLRLPIADLPLTRRYAFDYACRVRAAERALDIAAPRVRSVMQCVRVLR